MIVVTHGTDTMPETAAVLGQAGVVAHAFLKEGHVLGVQAVHQTQQLGQ